MVEFDDLRRMAVMLLSKEGSSVSKEQVEVAVDTVIKISPDFMERERLVRELEATFSITVADGTMLTEDSGHVPWLDSKRAALDWDFWRRYRTWLIDSKGWSPTVVNKLDSLTDQVLDRIEDPNRSGQWDRRGLVVGQVQSGKTSHYTGLICKAVDAGYKLIIVLAGVHNSLRSQTQLRLDEGFLGLDTKMQRAWKKNTNKFGAGLLFNKPLHVAYLTNSEDTGDFKKGIAKQIGIPLGSLPILLVIKKNSGVLRNLVAWLQTQANATDENGVPYFTDLPILLLDDEADHASINTKETLLDSDGKPINEQEATAINTRIRELLKMFASSVYVGYTATPFANVFIHPYVNTTQMGQDLFPRHFILNLPAPSNYLGPVQVFGLGEETDNALDQNGLPTVRIIDKVRDGEEEDTSCLPFADDFATLLPQNHRNGYYVQALPLSLKHAILAFILSCSVRAQRGQGAEHNSMLVHVTRFVSVQDRVAELIEQEIVAVRNRILFGDGSRSAHILDELKAVFEADFQPTTKGVMELIEDPSIARATWAQIEPFLRDAVSKITVKRINGSAKDVLDYFGATDGISVIAVGGDKLSRGLTLEGLTVSYYLRASRMYDTLMQMGRWFGYRPGYADVCRLYTTGELVDNYRHITIASEELRSDFDEMMRAGRTPEDFGLKVRTHPGSLAITAAGKMRNGLVMKVSFSGCLVESTKISKIPQDVSANLLNLSSFVAALGKPTHSDHHIEWREKPVELVIDFLQQLSGYGRLTRWDPVKLAEYVEGVTQFGELKRWNIAIISVGTPQFELGGGIKVGLSERTEADDSTKQMMHIRNRHIISEGHEWLDINDDSSARKLWRQDKRNLGKDLPKVLPGAYARKVRDADVGLLLLYLLKPEGAGLSPTSPPLLGYAASLPLSRTNADVAVSYLVTSIYAEEEFEDD
jgi:hypothetical protein